MNIKDFVNDEYVHKYYEGRRWSEQAKNNFCTLIEQLSELLGGFDAWGSGSQIRCGHKFGAGNGKHLFHIQLRNNGFDFGVSCRKLVNNLDVLDDSILGKWDVDNSVPQQKNYFSWNGNDFSNELDEFVDVIQSNLVEIRKSSLIPEGRLGRSPSFYLQNIGNDTISDTYLEKFKSLFDDRIGDRFSRAEITKLMIERYGNEVTEGSILPSDFCYNRWNKGLSDKSSYFKERAIFVLDSDELQYVYRGTGWAFSGQTLHSKNVIAEWIDGEIVQWFASKYSGNNTMKTSHKNNSKSSLNSIYFGPPGTGKTFRTIEASVIAAEPSFTWTSRAALKAEYNRLVIEQRIRFVTFHQSYGYEEFIEGLKASSDDGNISYDVVDGVFKRIAVHAEKFVMGRGAETSYCFDECWQYFTELLSEKDVIEVSMSKTSFKVLDFNNRSIFFEKRSGSQEHTLSISTLKAIFEGEREYSSGLGVYYRPLVKFLKDMSTPAQTSPTERKNFVLIIDEINRGNISKIFGELITLIEPSKRQGEEEALEVVLPYSGDTFSVPNNLHIIGTMNTADRSLAMMDTALRRRFDFVEMMPMPELFKNREVKGIDLTKLLQTLNNRIEVLYDREHLLGHAFLFPVFDEQDEELAFTQLQDAFKNKIIPLLEEYFYEDWNKICLVLGDNQKSAEINLIARTEQAYSDIFGSNHDLETYEDNKVTYKLKPFEPGSVWHFPEAYQAIYDSSVKVPAELKKKLTNEES